MAVLPHLIGLFTLLGVGLVSAIALAAITMAHRLAHPPRKTYAWAVSRQRAGTPMELVPPRAFEAVRLRLKGNECPAWEIAGENPSGPLVIFTPGWGDSKLGVLTRLDPVIRHASRLIAWDPPGHGETDASTTCGMGLLEPALLEELIRQQVESEPALGSRGVMLFGSSLGAGVSIVSGGTDRAGAVRGVIAEAPYRLARTPASNVMRLSGLPYRVNGPIAFLMLGARRGSVFWKGFDRAGHARRLACPLLVLHGTDDEVCPIADGEAIAAAAPKGKLATIVGGNHNELWVDERTRGACVAAVGEFLDGIAGTG